MMLASWFTNDGELKPRNGRVPYSPGFGWSKHGVVWPAVQSTALLTTLTTPVVAFVVLVVVMSGDLGSSQKTAPGTLKTPICDFRSLMLMLRSTAFAPTSEPVVARAELIVNGPWELYQFVKPWICQPPTTMSSARLMFLANIWPRPMGSG